MSIKTAIAKYGLGKIIDQLYEDPQKGMLTAIGWADKFSRGEFVQQRATVRKIIENEDDPYNKMIRRMLTDIDRSVFEKILINFFVNANLASWPTLEENRKKYNCNIPWAILLDPTSACNLHCTGCWAAEYGNKLNLSYEEIDDIITQGKELGVYMYIYTGGEPLVLRVGNFVPAISLEGFEGATDSRRGKGVYDHVIKAMRLLREKKLPFGVSACYTSQNYESISSEEFYDLMIDEGAFFVWFFHYMPVGNDASVELLPSPEQRTGMYKKIREYRATKPLFAMDFQNDAEFVSGCIAGGKRYLHINANGDIDPCVFVHYSDSNIREKTLLEALQSPMLMQYHDNIPFNDNMLMPCPMLENSGKLTEMVNAAGAHSTDLQSPESAEHLCAKTKQYADNWTPVAEKLWEERQKES